MQHLRHHRKGLLSTELAQVELSAAGLWRSLRHGVWQPRDLNWWIGTVFALGASLFLLGSVLCLHPALAAAWSLNTLAVNTVFFAGSIPFTTAAYLQLYQAANAPALPGDPPQPQGRVWFGWRRGNLGWLSAASQFIGTFLFNINTFDAMQPNLDWLQQDLDIWVPDMAGSALFLASGYLAVAECCHGRSFWQPRSLSWWITVINFLGCVAFMVSGVLAYVLAAGTPATITTASLLFTGIGAACFLAGALLLLPETAKS